MAFNDGTSFSCIVYLSRMDDFTDCDLLVWLTPDRSSSIAPLLSTEPPQSTANASKQRTLIARLFVRLKVEAIGGKTSFLTVLKSRTGRITGKHLIAPSTKVCVGESSPRWIRGRMSAKVSYGSFARLRFNRPSLNSFPEQLSATTRMFSRTTKRPASLLESRSWTAPFPVGKASLS